MNHEFQELYRRLKATHDKLFGGESRQAKAARKRKNDVFVGGNPAANAAALRRREKRIASVDPLPAPAEPQASLRKRRGRPPGRRSTA